MQSSGIGGGGFLLVYDHRSRKPWFVDFRESAPAAFKIEMMEDQSTKPYLMVGIPGELRGLAAAHNLYGRLSWSEVLQPAIKLARDGFIVSEGLAWEIRGFDRIKDLPSSARLKSLLYKADGTPLKAGDRISRPEFATTLETIAKDGIETFYSGDIAKQIVNELAKVGGILTLDDLQNYTAKTKSPLTSTFGDYTVLTAPPPSAGAAMILALNILEGYNITKDNITSPLYWHYFIETLKFNFAYKVRLGDPDFEPAVEEIVKTLLQKSTAKRMREMIKNDGVLNNYSMEAENVTQPEIHGTTHFSIVDSKDLYVSYTATLNHWFGSGFMTSGGIILNDELADFASAHMDSPEQHNLPAPGKRPLSNMVPTVIYHSQRACTNRIAIGGSNGTFIQAGVLNVIMNILKFGMNVTDAIEYPRVFADLPSNPVLVEEKLDRKIVDQLKALGHNNITRTDHGLNVVQAVMKNNKTVTAHSDSRKFGAAAIY